MNWKEVAIDERYFRIFFFKNATEYATNLSYVYFNTINKSLQGEVKWHFVYTRAGRLKTDK